MTSTLAPAAFTASAVSSRWARCVPPKQAPRNRAQDGWPSPCRSPGWRRSRWQLSPTWKSPGLDGAFAAHPATSRGALHPAALAGMLSNSGPRPSATVRCARHASRSLYKIDRLASPSGSPSRSRQLRNRPRHVLAALNERRPRRSPSDSWKHSFQISQMDFSGWETNGMD